ncbi:MAG: ABC transporter permease [Bacteriovoracaceae bacterium]|nr:ABC transporter permease [Bacteriovoracaceae bacterium]
MWDDLLISTLRLSLPLVFACFGALWSERSGVANIALESYLLFSAFVAGAVAHYSGNPYMGMAAGVAASGVVGFAFAVTTQLGRADHIVIGTAFNFLAAGSIPVFCRYLFNVTGSTPSLGESARLSSISFFIITAIIFFALSVFMFAKTRFGLRVHAAGENPMALISQGVNVFWLRVRAIVQGALMAGFGGVMLSLVLSSGYSRDMSAGRGFMALAALIFGGWRPGAAMLACLFFGFVDAMQIYDQSHHILPWTMPAVLMQATPYAVTLLLIIIANKQSVAPKAINQDLESFKAN